MQRTVQFSHSATSDSSQQFHKPKWRTCLLTHDTSRHPSGSRFQKHLWQKEISLAIKQPFSFFCIPVVRYLIWILSHEFQRHNTPRLQMTSAFWVLCLAGFLYLSKFNNLHFCVKPFFFLTSWDISVVSSLLSRAVLFYNALWVIFQPSSKSVLWTVAQIGKFSQAFWMILVFWKYTHTYSITILFHIKHHHWINDMFKNTSAWQQLWNAYYCESYWNDRIEIFISLN